MKVAFRVDASLCIGNGHLMRCLTLAHEFKKRGAEVIFISRKIRGDLNHLILNDFFILHELSYWDTNNPNLSYSEWLSENWNIEVSEVLPIVMQFSPDLLVVDHYALDGRWEQTLRPYIKELLVIDDLANRTHVCDYLLDQTVGRNENDYNLLTTEKAHFLLGTDYALLRPEFRKWRERSIERRTSPKFASILVTLGGVDKDNYTGRVLSVLKQYSLEVNDQISITVVLGQNAPNKHEVELQTKEMPCRVSLLSDVSNMAEIMANSDLCIGAAGSTAWERCCLALPSIVIVIADNQALIAKKLKIKKAALYVQEPIENELFDQLAAMSNSQLKNLSENSALYVDGFGAKRVVDKIISNEKYTNLSI
jgi:UDP-2,4-diacetamido-2,4,6-trideoxy-beta-L-altropyranose hydrolase